MKMNEIKTVEVGQTAQRSLLPDADSVITVGKGRGFIIEHRSLSDFGNGFKRLRRKLVVTASHCLPHAPVMPCYSYQETTYANLLAPLGEEPSVWADCLFFDPVSDLAILGEPDNQELGEESEAYARLVDGRKPFTVAAPETGEGHMLALDGVTWQPTPLEVHATVWGSSLSTGATLAGQSGSPIVDAKGRAVALVSIGSEQVDLSSGSRTNMDAGPQPILKLQLPSWVLKTVRAK
ncbi:MAG: trypsin-like peptidase domain-containing protein [Terriglobales bacterium]